MEKYEKQHISWRQRLSPTIGAVIVAIVCLCILYLGNNVGLSNNGDFGRILRGNHMSEISHEDADRYLFIQYYKMEVEGNTLSEQIKSVCRTNDEVYYSPQFQIIKASKILNLISNRIAGRDLDTYNIAYLAYIYIAMLFVAAWCIFTFFNDSSLKTKIGVFVVFLLIFCDAGYILYFNSLYGEPMQFLMIMLLISIGLMIYKRPSLPKVFLFFGALYLFAGAKLANIPYSILVAFLSVAIVFLRSDKIFRIGVVSSAVVCAIAIGCLYGAIPEWMHYDTTYQSVFYGALKDSETLEKDMEQLDIDEKYSSLANTHAYPQHSERELSSNDTQIINDVYEKVGKFDVVLFYMRHPVRFIKKVAKSIEYSAYIRPPNMGNSSVETEFVTNRFSLWSNLRVRVGLLYHPGVVFATLILLLAYVIIIDVFMFKKHAQFDGKNFYKLLSMNILVLGLWINAMLPVLGNGEADLAKHMFLFVNCMDILFAVGVISLLNMQKRNAIISLVGFAVLCTYINFPQSKEYVKFGTYEGKDIKWEVYDQTDDGKYVLITKDAIVKRSFDGQSNLWEESDLRTFLNNDFLKEFSNEDKEKIVPTINRNILSYDDRLFAIEGDHTHVCNYVSKYVDDLGKTAFHNHVEDMVFIPTPDMIENMEFNETFWIMCPYAANGAMERYANSDGFVLRAPVNRELGVRAVVTVNSLE